MIQRRERGYAMIAAVAAVAFFGYLALAAIAGGRSAVVAANAGLAHAKLAADADAGVALAVHDLGLSDPSRRWSLTGPPHQVAFQDADLTITLEDENGKIPINFVQAQTLRRLFEQAGADPRRIDGLVDVLPGPARRPEAQRTRRWDFRIDSLDRGTAGALGYPRRVYAAARHDAGALRPDRAGGYRPRQHPGLRSKNRRAPGPGGDVAQGNATRRRRSSRPARAPAKPRRWRPPRRSAWTAARSRCASTSPTAGAGGSSGPPWWNSPARRRGPMSCAAWNRSLTGTSTRKTQKRRRSCDRRRSLVTMVRPLRPSRSPIYAEHGAEPRRGRRSPPASSPRSRAPARRRARSLRRPSRTAKRSHCR